MTEENANTIAVHDYEPAIEKMRDDVLRGLARRPKTLPSQYLYDERGARLFERICETKEYYLTCTETAILRRNMGVIVDLIGPRALIIEPGSGSGVKTQLLLENLEAPALSLTRVCLPRICQGRQTVSSVSLCETIAYKKVRKI